VFNNAGTIDVIIDIVGYYVASTSGPAGPQGPPGANGTNGTNGTNGRTPAHIVRVATAGGDFTNVDAALASITTNSSSNRFLITVASGTYTVANTVVLKDYVDIEGSGEDTTEITCACGTNTAPSVSGSSATVRADSNINAEVRNITINNTGLNQYATAIWTGGTGAGTVKFTHVTANVSGGSSSGSTAIYINGNRTSLTHVVANASSSAPTSDVSGVFVTGSGPASLVGVDTSASGGGLENSGLALSFAIGTNVRDVRATASGPNQAAFGVSIVSSSNLTVSGVVASATASTGATAYGFVVSGASASGVNRISEVVATATSLSTAPSHGVFVIGSSRAALTDISATAIGGNFAQGLEISSASTSVLSATASASGGAVGNVGTAINNSSPTLTDLQTSAIGAGAATATGLEVSGAASVTMQRVDARATGVDDVYAILKGGSGTLTGTTISATANGSLQIAGLKVIAGTVNMAALTTGGSGTGLWVPTGVGVVVRDSLLSGSVASLIRGGGTMKVSNSNLSAAAIGVAAGSCINVIDDSTGALFANSDCT